MSDLTIIIQGNITQECFNFYLEHYKNYKIIISTWEGYSLSKENGGDFNCMESKFKYKPKIIVSKSIECGHQNFTCQVVSTLNALKEVKTKYVIKIRGDEYYSNIKYLYDLIKKNKNKIISSPIFFRKWLHSRFHISDHIIGGVSKNVKLMLQSSYDIIFLKEKNCDINSFTPQVSEQKLTYWYLKKKEPIINDTNEIDICKKHFKIFNIDLMKPYLVTSNCFKTKWYDNFVPEEWDSIKSLNEL
jgi:hypothetical protein